MHCRRCSCATKDHWCFNCTSHHVADICDNRSFFVCIILVITMYFRNLIFFILFTVLTKSGVLFSFIVAFISCKNFFLFFLIKFGLAGVVVQGLLTQLRFSVFIFFIFLNLLLIHLFLINLLY